MNRTTVTRIGRRLAAVAATCVIGTAYATTDLTGIAQVSAGTASTCAVSATGVLYCWGDNSSGQLGDGTTTNWPAAEPVIASGAIAVSTSRGVAFSGGPIDAASFPRVMHTCAIVTAGAVKCWGANESGQLGDGTHSQRLLPVDVAGLSSAAVSIATGGQHTCVVLSTGAVKCWGANQQGQLGDGTTTASNIPVTVMTAGAVSVTAGYRHTCVVTTSGGAKCWGANEAGQLGDGTTTDRALPGDVPSLSAGAGVTKLSAGGIPYGVYSSIGPITGGGGFTCALLASGAARCWGANRSGELGSGEPSGTGVPHTTPFEVAGFASNTLDLAAGGGWARGSTISGYTETVKTCFVTTAGAVKCAGIGLQQQAENPFYNPTPLPVPGLETGVAAVTAGSEHACVLTNTGLVKCWGSNAQGQLGHGDVNCCLGVITVQAGPLPQHISFNATPLVVVGQTVALDVGGGASGNPVVLSSLTASTCTVSGNSVTGVAVGSCTVAADQGGNARYDPGHATLTFDVGPGYHVQQQITFGFPPTVPLGGSVQVFASSSSGLAVTLQSNTPSVCTVSGNVVIGVASGTCVIAASQPGNAFYDPAPQVTQNLTAMTVGTHVSGISTRAVVGTGDNVSIAGFVIGGSAPKTVIIRARGPTLGLPGVLADTVLTLVPASGAPVLSNDDWGAAANATSIATSGYAPGNAKESAILTTLDPGAYTAIVSGAGNTTGLAIVEVYELTNGEIPVIGMSTRATVGTGDNVMIAGFVVQGSSAKTVVVRARGPSTGVAGALLNPTLTVVPASGGSTLTNDDWRADPNSATLESMGYAPSNVREAAMLVTLSPGAYTAVVSGVANTTGVAIVEVFVP